MGVYHILFMGCLYILGAYLYVNLIPEKWAPGSFDIWVYKYLIYFLISKGNSHQLFHILVFVAPLIHLNGAINAHEYWHPAINTGKSVCAMSSQLLTDIYLVRN